jgi:uncharacterized damage-inducible protein DinB
MSELDTDEFGRPEPPLAGTEAQTLLGFLDFQRATLEGRCRGLTDDQLRTTLHPTAITLAGLLKHLARVEDHWFSAVVAEQPVRETWASMPWAAEWDNHADHTGDELRDMWSARVDASRQVVAAALESDANALDATHPAWGGQARPSLRWVLTHMIEEYSRHNGHADLLRESIDGETGE